MYSITIVIFKRHKHCIIRSSKEMPNLFLLFTYYIRRKIRDLAICRILLLIRNISYNRKICTKHWKDKYYINCLLITFTHTEHKGLFHLTFLKGAHFRGMNVWMNIVTTIINNKKREDVFHICMPTLITPREKL